MALLVLGDLSVDVMGLQADDDRHFSKPRPLRRAKTLRAEEDTVATVIASAAHDDRLKDAAQRDVLGELRKLLSGNSVRGLLRVLVEEIHRSEQRFARGNGMGAEEIGLVRLGSLGPV